MKKQILAIGLAAMSSFVFAQETITKEMRTAKGILESWDFVTPCHMAFPEGPGALQFFPGTTVAPTADDLVANNEESRLEILVDGSKHAGAFTNGQMRYDITTTYLFKNENDEDETGCAAGTNGDEGSFVDMSTDKRFAIRYRAEPADTSAKLGIYFGAEHGWTGDDSSLVELPLFGDWTTTQVDLAFDDSDGSAITSLFLDVNRSLESSDYSGTIYVDFIALAAANDLEEVTKFTEPNGLAEPIELNGKTLIGVYDMFGRSVEDPFAKEEVLIYQYSNGTTEKVYNAK